MPLDKEILKITMVSKTMLINSQESNSIVLLEKEWAKYKYFVLGRDPNGYKQIRALLKDKLKFPVKEFYDIVDLAISTEPDVNKEINAAEHVLGYFKKSAASNEKKLVIDIMDKYKYGNASLSELKGALKKLAVKYEEKYLLDSYYFMDI